jgi:hypothetical protein
MPAAAAVVVVVVVFYSGNYISSYFVETIKT